MKIISFFLSILMFFFPAWNIPRMELDKTNWQNDYTDIFVPGFLGWGEGSPLNYMVPYWGTFGGDAVIYLRARGYNVRAARLEPRNSNWDRACELYANLTGTRTDYGLEHSKRCHHERYGRDYHGQALVKSFNAQDKVNLIGYSLGGTTVLQFLSLMAEGSEAERAATPAQELSDLFRGGKADWVHSVAMLASPMNGLSAFEMLDVIAKDPYAGIAERAIVAFCSIACKPIPDGRVETDSAMYDMTVDGAAELNERLTLPENVLYYSQPFCTTKENPDGTWSALRTTEPAFALAANRIGSFTAVTEKGRVIDETWFPSDGLVNTISEVAPFGSDTVDFNKEEINPGTWNIFPTYTGDHMMMMGDFLYSKNIRPFCAEFLNTLHEAA